MATKPPTSKAFVWKSVPQNPLVNQHYLHNYAHLGRIPIFRPISLESSSSTINLFLIAERTAIEICWIMEPNFFAYHFHINIINGTQLTIMKSSYCRHLFQPNKPDIHRHGGSPSRWMVECWEMASAGAHALAEVALLFQRIQQLVVIVFQILSIFRSRELSWTKNGLFT